ncbi:MAG: HPr family phosphocarrier protein [Eggerthellaceae bacterium]|nr:HPr family phosphocarrier protein [Eggerthellaceae bacterium]
MKEVIYKIVDSEGVHARLAGQLVKLAVVYKSNITIVHDGNEGDAKKIFSVMKLAVKQNGVITFKIEGPDEDAALAGIKKFFKEETSFGIKV